MKTILIAIAILLAVLSLNTKETAAMKLTKNDRILAFGDSLTYGYGANDSQSYPVLLSRLSGLKVINAGVNGDTSEDGLRRLPARLEDPSVKLMVLCFGGNDILQKRSMAQLKKNLADMIQMAKAKQIDVLLVSVPNITLFGLSALDLYEELAEEENVPLLTGLLSDILSQPSLKNDQIHPNAKGYKVMAEKIIWLSLLDNAGKRSEQEILESYMSAFKGKTLCILNQKDKFDETQIAQTTAYIQEKFSDYFSKVIAISAKMALQGRSLEPTVLIDQFMNGLINTFRKQLEAHPNCDSLSFFSEHFESFKEEVEQIRSLDISKVEAEVKASNIQEVIDYIEVEMRPNANALKAFRIQNDLKNICDILLNAYRTMTSVYDALDDILESAVQKSIEDLDVSKKHFGTTLSQLYHDIETNFQKISVLIYENIKPAEAYDYQSSSSFLHTQKIEKHLYETFRVDSAASMNRLFYNDALAERMNQKVFESLKHFETETAKALEEIYAAFEAGVLSWQHKYLLLSKNREISSDLEFSKVKRFASKVHENILNPFHLCFVHQTEAVHTQSAYLRGALSYNYMQTVQVTLAQLQEKIEESELTHRQDPSKFAIHKPNQEEIFKVFE